jgi:hypothetical protein
LGKTDPQKTSPFHAVTRLHARKLWQFFPGVHTCNVVNIEQTHVEPWPILVLFIIDFGSERGEPRSLGKVARLEGRHPELFCIGGNEVYVSDHFERWQLLASLISQEHDPEKLAAIANEMNRVLTQRTGQVQSLNRENVIEPRPWVIRS